MATQEKMIKRKLSLLELAKYLRMFLGLVGLMEYCGNVFMISRKLKKKKRGFGFWQMSSQHLAKARFRDI